MSKNDVISPEAEAEHYQHDVSVKVRAVDEPTPNPEVGLKDGITRRRFLFTTGVIGAGALLVGQGVLAFALPDKVIAYPAAKGALLVDTKKCANCTSCMIACSSVHYGEASYALSRIQIVFNPFAPYPQGARQAQCHQCHNPKCVAACPTGANHVDTKNGNVRTVDARKCIGCQKCIEACPFETSRVQWNHEHKFSQKCDLCVTSKYWSEKGGPDGKHACEEVCPMHAIHYSEKTPEQDGVAGYETNLRDNKMWGELLGFPAGNDGEYTPEQIKRIESAGAVISGG